MKFFSSEPFITEMTTISKNVKLGNGYKRIAIHGPMSGDREVPHVHIIRKYINYIKKYYLVITF